QPEEEKEELQQQRRVADDLDVDAEDDAERTRTAGLGPGADDGDDAAVENGLERGKEDQAGALRENAQRRRQPVEAQNLLIHPPASPAGFCPPPPWRTVQNCWLLNRPCGEALQAASIMSTIMWTKLRDHASV